MTSIDIKTKIAFTYQVGVGSLLFIIALVPMVWGFGIIFALLLLGLSGVKFYKEYKKAQGHLSDIGESKEM